MREIWGKLVGVEDVDRFLLREHDERLVSNLWERSKFGATNWGLLFELVCWLTWKWQNSFIFEGIDIVCNSLVAQAKGMANAFAAARGRWSEEGKGVAFGGVVAFFERMDQT